MTERRTDPCRVIGVPLPASAGVKDGLCSLLYPHTDEDLWQIAYKLGVLLQRENGYSEPALTDDPSAHALDAWLWIIEGRAVAVLTTQEQRGFFWLDEVEAGTNANWRESPESYQIVCVWVAENIRRQGISKRLVDAAAAHYGIRPEDFIHSPPFSEKGRAFAEKIAGGRVRVSSTRLGPT